MGSAASALESAKSYTDEEIANIKIGGRNLLRSTNQGVNRWVINSANGVYGKESIKWLDVDAVKMTCTTVGTQWKYIAFNGLLLNFDKLEAGAIYTLSYDTSGEVNVPFYSLINENGLSPIIQSKKLIKKETTTYGNHYEYRIVLNNPLTKDAQVVYFNNELTAGTKVTIANLKLERGNKATD